MIKKLVLLSAAMFAVAGAAGCATPGYSAKERGQQIARNWDMEFKMASDDVDHFFLLRPMSSLSRWNIK